LKRFLQKDEEARSTIAEMVLASLVGLSQCSSRDSVFDSWSF